MALCGELRVLAVTSRLGIRTRPPLPTHVCRKPALPHAVGVPTDTPSLRPCYTVQGRLRMLRCGCRLGHTWKRSKRAAGPGVGGSQGAPLCPVVPRWLSETLTKGASEDLGTHVYFMNDFRERGEKTIQNVIQEAAFFLLRFVSKHEKWPHLILPRVPWDASD